MSSKVLDQKLQTYRLEVDELAKDLHQLTIDIGTQELSKTVSELRNRINEPFMFVVVGEVKSGKSSFVNALLESEKEICKVAPDPCTDTIQQIIYGEEEATLVLNPHLKKILIPAEILKEIAIVDTPGTNTIIENHQEITREFIPASDLIVFVFEAKNPYRQSAWEFFDFINKDWRKKVVFVLQQSDLMDPEDLVININGVLKMAKEKGMEAPKVFALSAKQELAGKKEDSGFEPLRAYIREHITGGKAPILKLQNNLTTARTLSDRIGLGIDDRRAQVDADRTFRADVTRSLDEQEIRSHKHVALLVETLLAEYDRLTRQSQEEVVQNLGFFSLVKRTWVSAFSSEPGIKNWFTQRSEKLEADLNDSFDRRLRDGVVDIADSIQQMAKIISLKLEQSKAILKKEHAIFGDIADRRSAVLNELQQEFATFMKREENFLGTSVLGQDPNLSPNMVAGSGIAVIGVVITVVTQTTALDITGGVITALGLMFAGLTVTFKRRKILNEFQAEINKGRERIEEEVTGKLKTYIAEIKRRIDENFHDFDALIEHETRQVQVLETRHHELDERLEDMEKRVEQELAS